MPAQPDSAPGAAIVRQVQARGIDDPRVLSALARVPRFRFVPPSLRPAAEADRALPIGFNQTISQPYMVAAMTQALSLTGPERVLEIGTGSGYQTAILSLLAAEVFTVERLPTLSLRARSLLDGLGCENIHFLIADGSLGWPDEAPFDRILVTAGAPRLPRALFSQLVEDGLLVIPLGRYDEQDLHLIRKHAGKPLDKVLMPCQFVRLVGDQGWPEGR